MGKMNVNKLLPGMVLGTDVYNMNDQLILPEGLVLNERAIEKLKFYDINYVNIKDADPSIEEEEEEGSYAARLRATPEFKQFKQEFEQAVGEMSRMVTDVVLRNAPLDSEKLVSDALRMLHPPTGDINVFDMVHNMRAYDDITFAHSMNVGLICNVFAGWMGFNEEEQRLATECGILHDIRVYHQEAEEVDGG